jgi:hypothetical protein
MTVRLGIAGWPLRNAPEDCLALAFRLGRAPIVEIPKDLLDRISIKRLFGIVARSGKTPCLAGTTDFAGLGGLGWRDYRRYLDIQAAQARFLGCRMMRLFLAAPARADFGRALARVADYAATLRELEIVIETHGGWETTPDGLARLLGASDLRLVVDFSNIRDAGVREALLGSVPKRRIAYFHLRNLPGLGERPSLAAIESRAVAAFPRHAFLWEPKTLSGARAVAAFRAHARRAC